MVGAAVCDMAFLPEKVRKIRKLHICLAIDRQNRL
jgi:hypothetical protein